MSWLANSPGGALKMRNILSQIVLWKNVSRQNIVFHHFRLARTWAVPSFEHYQSDFSLLDGSQQNMRLGYPVRTTLLPSVMRFDFIRARVRAQTPTDWLWHLIFTAVVLDFLNLAWLALRSLR